jgi:Tol biopolymer transport system component
MRRSSFAAVALMSAVALSACSASSGTVVIERKTRPPALTAAGVEGSSPSASPSPVAPLQGHIAFASDRVGDFSQIFTMNADGTSVTQVSDGPTDVIQPSYAPNGKLIAYVRVFTNGPAKNFVVYVWDESGGDQPATPADGEALNPTWSPNGRFIAVTDESNGQQRVAAFEPATRGSLQGITQSVPAFDPAFSPDGTHVAFSQLEKGCLDQKQQTQCLVHIWSMDLQTGTSTQLTTGNEVAIGAAWSPDGTRIAFATSHGRSGNFDIYAMNTGGTNVLQLTHAPDADLNPAWSPDGTWIAFSSRRDGNSEVYTMHADGTQQTNVTQDPAQDTDPSWGL